MPDAERTGLPRLVARRGDLLRKVDVLASEPDPVNQALEVIEPRVSW